MFSAQCFCHRASMSAKGYPPVRTSAPVSATSATALARVEPARSAPRGTARGTPTRGGERGRGGASAGPRDGGGGAQAVATDRGERARARRHRGGAAGGESGGRGRGGDGQSAPGGKTQRHATEEGARETRARSLEARRRDRGRKARRGGAGAGRRAGATRSAETRDKAAPVVLGDVDVRVRLMRALMRRGRNKLIEGNRPRNSSQKNQKIGLDEASRLPRHHRPPRSRDAPATHRRRFLRARRRVARGVSTSASRSRGTDPRAPSPPPRRLDGARGERSRRRLGDGSLRRREARHRARSRARARPASTRRRASRPRVARDPPPPPSRERPMRRRCVPLSRHQ